MNDTQGANILMQAIGKAEEITPSDNFWLEALRSVVPAQRQTTLADSVIRKIQSLWNDPRPLTLVVIRDTLGTTLHTFFLFDERPETELNIEKMRETEAMAGRGAKKTCAASAAGVTGWIRNELKIAP